MNLALDDARRLNLPEAGQIDQFMEQAGLGPMPTKSAEEMPPGVEIDGADRGVHGDPADQGWDALTGLAPPRGPSCWIW